MSSSRCLVKLKAYFQFIGSQDKAINNQKPTTTQNIPTEQAEYADIDDKDIPF